jgi:hypothetical protein
LIGTPEVGDNLDGRERGLFVVLQDKGKDVDHFPVSAGLFQEMKLQGPEGIRKLSEGSTIAKGTGLALNDSQIVPSVIDGLLGPSCDRL